MAVIRRASSVLSLWIVALLYHLRLQSPYEKKNRTAELTSRNEFLMRIIY